MRLSPVLLLASAFPAYAGSYVVCDNGLRCIMAPCPSYNALDLHSGKIGRITNLDPGGLSAHDGEKLANDSTSHVLDGNIKAHKSSSNRAPEIVLSITAIERPATKRERNLCRRSG